MKLVCLGDSLTEGYEIDNNKSWTELLQKELNVEVINAGISGDTTSGMLARCEKLLLEHQPSHLIIFGGTNDLWFGLKDEFILSNIHAMRRQAKYHDVIPIIGILTPSVNLNELNIVHENYAECISGFRNTLIKYCEDDNQVYIDFALQLEERHFFEDGLHPNEKGQEVMMMNANQLMSKFK